MSLRQAGPAKVSRDAVQASFPRPWETREGHMEPTALKVMIVSMLTWISAHTNYPMPTDAPMIALVPHEYIESVACQGPCDVIGVYTDERVVYLQNTLAIESNVCAQSVLLHELVHYNQDLNNRFANLPPVFRWQLREREAQDVQKMYLSEFGRTVDFSKTFQLGAFSGDSCGYPQYAGG